MKINIIKKWVEANKGNGIDIVIAGRVFGGRHGESPQIPKEFSYVDEILKMQFNTTELLTIINPSDIVLGEYEQLIIPNASEVVWGWHYYGRPQIDENWCEEIYKHQGDKIELDRTGPLMPGRETFSYNDNSFIELL